MGLVIQEVGRVTGKRKGERKAEIYRVSGRKGEKDETREKGGQGVRGREVEREGR